MSQTVFFSFITSTTHLKKAVLYDVKNILFSCSDSGAINMMLWGPLGASLQQYNPGQFKFPLLALVITGVLAHLLALKAWHGRNTDISTSFVHRWPASCKSFLVCYSQVTPKHCHPHVAAGVGDVPLVVATAAWYTQASSKALRSAGQLP